MDINKEFKIYENVYNTILNRFKKQIPTQSDVINWIDENHKMIYDEFICHTNLNIKTKYTYLQALIKIFFIKGNAKIIIKDNEKSVSIKSAKYKKLFEKYTAISHELKKQINDKLLDQEIIPNRANSWVKWEIIQKRYDDFKLMSQSKPDNYHLNQLLVTSSLFVLYVPLRRSDYYNVLIVNEQPVSSKIQNYMWVQENQTIFYDNKYKTVNKYGPQIIYFENELHRIIKSSLDKYPRKYLLTILSDKNKPTMNNIDKSLERVFGKNVKTDILRSSYVTYFHSMHESDKERNALSKKMLHNLSTATWNYKKVQNKDDVKDDVNEDVKEDNKDSRKRKNKTPSNLLKNQKTYYEKNKTIKKEISQKRRIIVKDNPELNALRKRKRYLSDLNSSRVKNPMPHVLQSYNIVLNPVSNKYE